jgi:hypothetical protein
MYARKCSGPVFEQIWQVGRTLITTQAIAEARGKSEAEVAPQQV